MSREHFKNLKNVFLEEFKNSDDPFLKKVRYASREAWHYDWDETRGPFKKYGPSVGFGAGMGLLFTLVSLGPVTSHALENGHDLLTTYDFLLKGAGSIAILTGTANYFLEKHAGYSSPAHVKNVAP
jgi:hypothetical protein